MKAPWLVLSAIFIASFCGSTQVKENTGSPEEQEVEKSVYEQTMSSIDGQEIMPLQYKTIYIEHFNNNSYDAQGVVRLKEKLQNRFNRDGRLTVETDKQAADVWLVGTIEALNQAPAAFDQFRQPTTYLYTGVVTIKVRANPKHGGEIVLDKKLIRYDTRYSPRIPPFESKFEARERLFDTLTERILYTTYNGWYSNIKTNNELGYDPDASSKPTTTSRNETTAPEGATKPPNKTGNTKDNSLLDYLTPEQKNGR